MFANYSRLIRLMVFVFTMLFIPAERLSAHSASSSSAELVENAKECKAPAYREKLDAEMLMRNKLEDNASVEDEMTLRLDKISTRVSLYSIHIDWMNLQTRPYEFVIKLYGPSGGLIVHQLSRIESKSIAPKGYWTTQLELLPKFYKTPGFYRIVICESGFMQGEKILEVYEDI